MAKTLHDAARFLREHAQRLRQISDMLLQRAARRDLLSAAERCEALAQELDEAYRFAPPTSEGERRPPPKERR